MMNLMMNKNAIITEKYNTAIGEAYYQSIKRLIRKYYKKVSDTAIDEYINSGDFTKLTAKELLSRSGFDLMQLEQEKEQIAAKFIASIEMQSSANFRQGYKEIKQTLPDILVQPIYMSQTTKNLVSQQVQKISGLFDLQYDKINNALQNTIVEKRNLTYFKQALRDAGIANEKRIKTIAYNQLHYATNMVNTNKATELGIKKGIWRHPPKSHYKTEGRPSHIKADGKVFNLEKGCKIDGEFIHPAQLPNCKCYFQLVI